ncbi:hypothetical protein HYW99_03825 [Candidatus Woesearchaeota archaeon]|nr:hypothetical protein [Candidatus Woesearchaeota archaeon]
MSISILISGYALVNIIKDKLCDTELKRFEIELSNIDKGIRYAHRELKSYKVPCRADQVYFFDISENIEYDSFRDIPIMMDSLKSKANDNIFLVKGNEVITSFNVGNIKLSYPHYICFVPLSEKISFFVEGAGRYVKLTEGIGFKNCG